MHYEINPSIFIRFKRHNLYHELVTMFHNNPYLKHLSCNHVKNHLIFPASSKHISATRTQYTENLALSALFQGLPSARQFLFYAFHWKIFVLTLFLFFFHKSPSPDSRLYMLSIFLNTYQKKTYHQSAI